MASWTLAFLWNECVIFISKRENRFEWLRRRMYNRIKVKDSPVVNIIPNTDDIVDELEKLILNKDNFREIGINSREFVEDNHGHYKVAKMYLEEWRGIDL